MTDPLGIDEEEKLADKDDELTMALSEVHDAEREFAFVEGQRAKARQRLVDLLAARGEKSLVGWDMSGRTWKVTVVESETTKIDADGLRADIGARAFNKLTERKLDARKIEAAVANGSLSVEDLANYTTITPRARWPKITELK